MGHRAELRLALGDAREFRLVVALREPGERCPVRGRRVPYVLVSERGCTQDVVDWWREGAAHVLLGEVTRDGVRDLVEHGLAAQRPVRAARPAVPVAMPVVHEARPVVDAAKQPSIAPKPVVRAKRPSAAPKPVICAKPTSAAPKPVVRAKPPSAAPKPAAARKSGRRLVASESHHGRSAQGPLAPIPQAVAPERARAVLDAAVGEAEGVLLPGGGRSSIDVRIARLVPGDGLPSVDVSVPPEVDAPVAGAAVVVWFARQGGVHGFQAKVRGVCGTMVELSAPAAVVRYCRRRAPRYRLDARDRTRVTVPLSDGTRWRETGRLRDVSTGGITLELPSNLDIVAATWSGSGWPSTGSASTTRSCRFGAWGTSATGCGAWGWRSSTSRTRVARPSTSSSRARPPAEPRRSSGSSSATSPTCAPPGNPKLRPGSPVPPADA